MSTPDSGEITDIDAAATDTTDTAAGDTTEDDEDNEDDKDDVYRSYEGWHGVLVKLGSIAAENESSTTIDQDPFSAEASSKPIAYASAALIGPIALIEPWVACTVFETITLGHQDSGLRIARKDPSIKEMISTIMPPTIK